MSRAGQAVTVSGPNVDRADLPTDGAGISLATTRAWSHGTDGTWYVRGEDRYAVERRGRVVHVTQLGKEAA